MSSGIRTSISFMINSISSVTSMPTCISYVSSRRTTMRCSSGRRRRAELAPWAVTPTWWWRWRRSRSRSTASGGTTPCPTRSTTTPTVSTLRPPSLRCTAPCRSRWCNERGGDSPTDESYSGGGGHHGICGILETFSVSVFCRSNVTCFKFNLQQLWKLNQS